MHITCRYSGVNFLCQGFGKLKYTGQHPMMEVPVNRLISRARDWLKGDLDETERRILFVALLKATDCVEFRVPAIPSKQTIEANMELLLETVNWLQVIGNYVHLAKYRVTEHTYRLKNIGTWLDIWQDSKRLWDGKTAEWHQRETLYRREEAFLKLIRSPLIDIRRYQKRLGQLATDAAGVPDDKKEYWVELFNLRDDEEIMNHPKVDFEEMLVWFQDHLKIGSTVTNKIFSIVYDLIKKREGGIEGLIGLEDSDNARMRALKHQDLTHNKYIIFEENDEENEEDEFEAEVRREKNRRLFGDEFAGLSQQQITERIAAENRKRVMKLAPVKMPVRENYASKLEFLTDLSAWNIAQREYQKQQEEVTKKQEELKRERDALSQENTLDLPFRDIDPEVDNIINLTARRAEGSKDE